MENSKIYEFSNYRLFLNNYAESKKKFNVHWSKSQWAKKLGLKGTASLTMILNGERKPGKKITSAFVNYFKFNKREKDFFLNLIELEKTSDESLTKNLILNELEKLYPYKNFELFNSEHFKLFSSWEPIVLRRLAFFKNFKFDLDQIYKGLQFKISKHQIKKIINSLESFGLLEIKNGTICTEKSNLKTTNDIPQEAIKKFHESAIENSLSSIRKLPVEKRELQSLTLEFESKDIALAKQEIRNFIDSFNTKFKTINPNSIYQLNLQFIPYFEINKIETEGAPK